jgi:ABC-2 type transport system permease protein
LTCLVFGCIGIFASAVTKNQISAFIMGFMFCFALYIMGKMTVFMPGQISTIANFLGTDMHLDNLSRGIIDTRDIFYYLSLSGFFLFLVYVKLNISRAS